MLINMKPTIRYTFNRDINQIVEIEQACFEFPWSKNEFVKLNQPYIDGIKNATIGIVAEWQEKIIGYLYYTEESIRYRIINIAVHPDFRRQKVFTILMDKVLSNASRKQKMRVVVAIRETNLFAQLAFKSLGFKAVKILKNFYDVTDEHQEDAYAMRYKVIDNKTLQAS